MKVNSCGSVCANALIFLCGKYAIIIIVRFILYVLENERRDRRGSCKKGAELNKRLGAIKSVSLCCQPVTLLSFLLTVLIGVKRR